jgi:hypothetical protein
MGGAKALLFCEQKRSKKNFAALGLYWFRRHDTNERSFLLLFFQKSSFFLSSLIARKRRSISRILRERAGC